MHLKLSEGSRREGCIFCVDKPCKAKNCGNQPRKSSLTAPAFWWCSPLQKESSFCPHSLSSRSAAVPLIDVQSYRRNLDYDPSVQTGWSGGGITWSVSLHCWSTSGNPICLHGFHAFFESREITGTSNGEKLKVNYQLAGILVSNISIL